ncbi:hypothetical protein A3758_13880 [Oleiphilus sp. HI0118]|nr:hypothetical protein A3758_19980 [Oleiphilus sp. HI0118]KZZ48363.1 hypothetical protein A3758_13880 [Oleiphilus sp. HI0118]
MSVGRFFTDAIGFGVASFLTKGAALLVVPVLTRSLSPSEFGAFEILIGLAGLCTVLVAMSLESYLAREWGLLEAVAEKQGVFSSLVFAVLFASIALLSISWLFSGNFSNFLFDTPELGQAFFFVLLSGSVIAITGLPLMVLRMERRIRPYLAVIGVQSASYLALIFWLLSQERIDVHSTVASMLAANVASLMFGAYFVRHYFAFKFDLAILRPALRYGLPLLPAVGATWINAQVDKYALLYFFDAKTVGEFAVVTKVAAILTMGVMVFRQAWLPYSFSLARRIDHGTVQFRRVLAAYYGIGLTCCLVLVYFSEFVFFVLAPGSYQIEVGILPVLLLASLVYGSASIVNVGMMVSGKTEWNSYASFIGVSLNILLTIALVPTFGVAGAAWGTLIASMVFALILSEVTKGQLGVAFGYSWVLLAIGFLIVSMAALPMFGFSLVGN